MLTLPFKNLENITVSREIGKYNVLESLGKTANIGLLQSGAADRSLGFEDVAEVSNLILDLRSPFCLGFAAGCIRGTNDTSIVCSVKLFQC